MALLFEIKMQTSIIHRSLYQNVLFVGCERLPFMLVIVIGGVVVMLQPSLLAIIGVIIFYLVMISLIRYINKNDSQYFLCLYRYLRYGQDYYPVHEFYPGRSDKPQSNFG